MANVNAHVKRQSSPPAENGILLQIDSSLTVMKQEQGLRSS